MIDGPTLRAWREDANEPQYTGGYTELQCVRILALIDRIEELEEALTKISEGSSRLAIGMIHRCPTCGAAEQAREALRGKKGEMG